MTKSWLVPAALLAMIAGPAFAADMPVKAPPPPPAPVATWTGFYTGFEAGEVWQRSDWDPTCVDTGGPPFGTCITGPLVVDSNARFRTSTGRFGIYSGWMFQAYDRWVFGAESDFAFSKKDSTVGFLVGCASVVCNGGFPPPPFTGDSSTLHLGNDFSMRARAGFLVLPELQLYVAAGPAAQKVSATLVCSGTGVACINTISTFNETTLVGYTVGAGLEWKVWDHLLLRGEYRYNDYGTWKQGGFLNSGQFEEFANIHVKTQQVNFGIAWLFGVPKW